MAPAWYEIENAQDVFSPALLVSRDRVIRNIRKMIARVGRPELLRPHIKTHKMPAVVDICQQQGIQKFKCATPAEAEILGECQAADVLLAVQPVGPTVGRLKELVRRFPATSFSAIIDDCDAATLLSQAFEKVPLAVWVDLDCGMHRTGVAVLEADGFLTAVKKLQGLRLIGLHAYDGHIHDTDLSIRKQRCKEAFQPIYELMRRHNLPLIAGGSPTFPYHADPEGSRGVPPRIGGETPPLHSGADFGMSGTTSLPRRLQEECRIECSPGTPVFWDFGYAEKFPDMDFEIAAVILTRIIGKLGASQLCLDLGYKAVASENPQPRVLFPQLPGAQILMQSEEHLVLQSPDAPRFNVGDVLYALPRHICPTCALYGEASVVDQRRVFMNWKIPARARRISL